MAQDPGTADRSDYVQVTFTIPREMVPYLRVCARMMEQAYQPSGSNTLALNTHHQQHPVQEACVSSSSASAKNSKVVIKRVQK